MATYTPISTNTWHGRIDGNDEDSLRWHQVIRCIDLGSSEIPRPLKHQQGIAIIGFCCDEGVKRNLGRTGAKQGPAAIRNACRNFPFFASQLMLTDVGDITCDDGGLEEAQELLAVKIKLLRSMGYLPIVLGGGHEVSFANFSGLKPMAKNSEFGIINFDAHFDLRALEPNKGATSGTGIWQMQEYCSQHRHPFHYLVIGIQQYSNTLKLFNTADNLGAVYFLAENFTNDQLEHLLHVINGMINNSDTIQLTIDMDVFAAAHAPGVSAVAYNGIAPNSMFKRLLRHIILSGKVATVDIAETNPLHDVDGRTARLAASIVFDIIQAADKNADW